MYTPIQEATMMGICTRSIQVMFRGLVGNIRCPLWGHMLPSDPVIVSSDVIFLWPGHLPKMWDILWLNPSYFKFFWHVSCRDPYWIPLERSNLTIICMVHFFSLWMCSLNPRMDFFVEGLCVSHKWCGGLMVIVLTENVKYTRFESLSLHISDI